MKTKIIILVVFTIFLTSCSTSPSPDFSSFYNPWLEENKLLDVITLKEGQGPRIINSNNMANDFFEIISNHYICIGHTSLRNRSLNIDDIKKQCVENGATIAIYGESYSVIGKIDEDGGYVSAYRSHDNNHHVFYFVQKNDIPKFGCWLRDLYGDGSRFQRNTGAFVYVVYKDTPAFYANILRGDIIIRINEYEIKNINDFEVIINRFSIGNELEVGIIRNAQSIIVKLKL